MLVSRPCAAHIWKDVSDGAPFWVLRSSALHCTNHAGQARQLWTSSTSLCDLIFRDTEYKVCASTRAMWVAVLRILLESDSCLGVLVLPAKFMHVHATPLSISIPPLSCARWIHVHSSVVSCQYLFTSVHICSHLFTLMSWAVNICISTMLCTSKLGWDKDWLLGDKD
jgi:hypothetical protein